MVMCTHFTYLLTAHPGAWGFASTGVDLFFVLSGFVFAPYLFGKPLRVVPHLIRRFFRLYPLYLCALLLYAFLKLPPASAWDHFGVHLVMAHTASSLEIAGFYNAAFWSLPPEVEYYLLLPLLAWAAARSPFIGLLLASAAMHMLLVAATPPDEQGVTARAIATVHAPGLLIEFMLGSMAYAMAHSTSGAKWASHRLVLGFVVLAGMVGLFAVYVAPVTGTSSKPPLWIGGNMGVGAALGYALVVSALARPALLARPSFTGWSAPWLVLMGQLSYGVYLFHNAAPQLLSRAVPGLTGAWAALASTAITLCIALAAHRMVERPMRNFGRRIASGGLPTGQ
jgi:peptidoglycan/LPS O-acetylase OafA/YrhL